MRGHVLNSEYNQRFRLKASLYYVIRLYTVVAVTSYIFLGGVRHQTCRYRFEKV